jgi:Domain of unknown function (DUF4190)
MGELIERGALSSVKARNPGGQMRMGRANWTAKAALICGIVGFVVPLIPIVAIILGHLAVREIRRSGGQGLDLAKAGIILGYVGLVLSVLVPLLVGGILAGNPPGP